ncbi:protein yippee-like 2 [Cetorhinus maximus]
MIPEVSAWIFVLKSLERVLDTYNLATQSFQSFQGSQGRAYLFNSVDHTSKSTSLAAKVVKGAIEIVNVGCGPAEERVLLTGLHAVADIYCENCKTTLGWKYEHAFESSQKYKEGKYIIELAHMIKDNGWE